MRTSSSDRDGRTRPGRSALLMGVAILALPAGMLWMSRAITDAAPTADADGRAVYASRCVPCHQLNGQGIPGVFPPLDGTEWVVGDKGRLIRILLDGLTGETKVQGVLYTGAMPPWKTFLNDEEIAAVLTYVRSSWTNDAPTVSTGEVTLVREATKNRNKPWTEEELIQEANLGIPGMEARPGSLGPARPRADTTGH